MGTKGRSIVNMDVNELLKLLNKAYSDEWLAHYQYWIGAKIVKMGWTQRLRSTALIRHAAARRIRSCSLGASN